MAKATIEAPSGYHFMVDRSNNFYLMKTAQSGYVSHVDGEYTSQLSVQMEVRAPRANAASTRKTHTAPTSSGTTRSTSRRGGY